LIYDGIGDYDAVSMKTAMLNASKEYQESLSNEEIFEIVDKLNVVYK